MYRVDLYARVRRACRVEGMSTHEASRMFGVDRKTVRKMLSFSVPLGYRRSAPPRRPKPEAEDGEGGALLFRDAKPGHYARRRKRVSP